ncbi:hypothetical protein ACFX2B_024207 [Malus domestica]
MSRRYDSRTTIFSPEGRLYQVDADARSFAQFFKPQDTKLHKSKSIHELEKSKLKAINHLDLHFTLASPNIEFQPFDASSPFSSPPLDSPAPGHLPLPAPSSVSPVPAVPPNPPLANPRPSGPISSSIPNPPKKPTPTNHNPNPTQISPEPTSSSAANSFPSTVRTAIPSAEKAATVRRVRRGEADSAGPDNPRSPGLCVWVRGRLQVNSAQWGPATNTLLSHASYAFTSYLQNTKVAGGTCDAGTAMLVTVDPSYDECNFFFNG